MINLHDYLLENSVKANKYVYVPKRYLAGFINSYKGEKSTYIFRSFMNEFNSNGTHRQGFDDFIEEVFELGDVKRIVSIKDSSYSGMNISDINHIHNSLNNGLNLIKEMFGEDRESEEDAFVKELYLTSLAYVKEFINREGLMCNCDINQGLFDFVIAREYLLNQSFQEEGEIRDRFFTLTQYQGILKQLFDGIKEENRHRCIDIIRHLSLFAYDPRFEVHNLDKISSLNIDELFYLVGNNIDILINVLNFGSEDLDTVLPQLFEQFLSTLDTDILDIVKRRDTETLQEIGDSYNLTRERVRQKEEKAIELFTEFYQNNLCSVDGEELIFAIPEASSVFPLNYYKNQLKDNNGAFRNLLSSIERSNKSKYVKEVDAVVDSDNTLDSLRRIGEEIFSDYFKVSDIDQKINDCLLVLEPYGFDKETLMNYINSEYKQRGKIYIRNSLTYSKTFMSETILKLHFDNGFHFSDIEQIKEMNTYSVEEFGEPLYSNEEMNSPTCHTIQAITERSNTRLCDRGTYIHSSKAPDLPDELVHRIISYINQKNRPVAYSNIFETFENELFELGINNKYSLQSALSPYRKALFDGKRDYACPLNSDLTLRDNMITWMKSRNGLFTYDDFKNEYKGVAQSVFMSVVYDCQTVGYYWLRGYIDVDKFPITKEDLDKISMMITLLINQYGVGYCSADELFDLINSQMNDFIIKCDIKYSYDLFSILEIKFRDKFQVKRPLIGNIGSKLNNIYVVIDKYLELKTVINAPELRKFIDAKAQSANSPYLTILEVVKNKWNEFVAIDSESLVRKDVLNVSSKELSRLETIVDMLLEDSDSINIEDIIEKHLFKEIGGIKTNKHLVFGLLNTYFHDKYQLTEKTNSYKNGAFSIELKNN